MNEKRVDKKIVAGLILFVALGIMVLITGLFFNDVMDAYYANTQGIGMMASAHAVIRKVGYQPVALVIGAFMCGFAFVGFHKKLYLTDENVVSVDKPEVY